MLHVAFLYFSSVKYRRHPLHCYMKVMHSPQRNLLSPIPRPSVSGLSLIWPNKWRRRASSTPRSTVKSRRW